MKISDIVMNLNGEMTASAVAKELGVSTDTVSRRLKTVGYEYNKNSRTYDFVGELSDKNNIDEMNFSDIIKKKNQNKSDKSNNKIIKKSDKNNESEEQNSDLKLTNDEIKFIKGLCEHQSDIQLIVELSLLPIRNKSKKHQMEISETTLNDFEEFAKKMKDRRFSKNDLMEIALVRLMREFG